MTTSCPAPYSGPAGALFNTLIQSLLASQCLLGNPDDYPDDYGKHFKRREEFDFIVIGAGAGGSAVAGRLSEDFKVLLLEAGGNPNPTSDIPQLTFNNIVAEPDMIWQYQSDPNDYSLLSMRNHSCQIQRGKVLGGSTVINLMQFVRGNKQDYEDWKSYGNEGWGYDDVLPYFKKLENYGEDNEYHSSSGPMPAVPFGTTENLDNLKNLLCESFVEVGVPRNADINGENQIGCTISRGILINGTRANTGKMYLKDQNNLKVIKKALVQKIEIINGKAVGVFFQRERRTHFAKVKNEVILGAGTIGSPQILMLSGVGPEEELKKHGIKVKVNSIGVGKNLHDHLAFYGMFFYIKKENAGGGINATSNDNYYEYLEKRTGSLASFMVSDTLTLLDTNFESDVPDIQVENVLLPKENKGTPKILYGALGFNNNISQQLNDALDNGDIWSSIPIVIQPKSRGEVVLKSAKITDYPIIRPKYLSDDEDIEVMIKGIKIAKKVMLTSKFDVLQPEELVLSIEECSGLDKNSDDFLVCQIRHLATSFYHFVGTCKMGPSTDSEAVVDNKLRVRGVPNIRVADCSIMPKITRGNTMIPAVMIGEKAADTIKQDWQ